MQGSRVVCRCTGSCWAADGLHASGRRMLASMQLLTRPSALQSGAQAFPLAAARATMLAWPSTAATTSACTASWRTATSTPQVRGWWWGEGRAGAAVEIAPGAMQHMCALPACLLPIT